MKYPALWFFCFPCLLLSAQQPGDTDGDGRVNETDSALLIEALLGQKSPMVGSDCNLDGFVDFLDLICLLNLQSATLLKTSPAPFETGVAVTRETVFSFSSPLDPNTLAPSIQVTADGNDILFQTHLAPDGKTLYLFYPQLLPEGTTLSILLRGDSLRTLHGIAVDLDRDGYPGGDFLLEFETLAIQLIAGTAVVGRVFASEQVAVGNQLLDIGLAGVTLTVDGAEHLSATTDALGNFRMDPAPAGRFFVHIDGRSATGVTHGGSYPLVGKAWEAAPGKETQVGNVFLPLIRQGTLQDVSLTEPTEIRFPDSILEDFPELSGTRLLVPADALFDEAGNRGGRVGIAPVAPDRLPGVLPSTMPLPLVITVQTDGATNFDIPVDVCLPNLPDPITGELTPPGGASALVSFNHDSGRFEVVGAMTVSDDGLLVCSLPGEGIRAPGWHGARIGTSGGGGRPFGGPRGDADEPDTLNDPEDRPDREYNQEKGPQSPPFAQPPSQNADSPKNACPPEGADPDKDSPVDPVFLFSGEFYHDEEDLRIKGRGFDFVWARRYRSQLTLSTAQGNSWDFSYNIRVKWAKCGKLQPQQCELIIYDGNTRRDRYRIGVDGQFSKDEFFRTIVAQPDGSFTLTFADQAQWRFLPLDGSLAEGKITQILDRNHNAMNFQYDGLGRLTTITDTLGRDITVAYTGIGAVDRIASITDFTGRSVRYTYYDGTESGGNSGDLKQCTGPAVLGTVHGRDFPNGKTTSYTYQERSSGTGSRLWGNLLTITDGRRNDPDDPTYGQGPWLVNSYDSGDRLTRQVWGGAIVDITYVPVFPTAANHFATLKTLVNDRVGHVKEYWWDQRHRCLLKREYTGSADPTLPTTPTANRPSGKLRAGDPDFYDTRYSWTMDSLKAQVVHPNGDTTQYIYERDLNPNAPARLRGNLRIVRHLPGPLGGDQDVIEEQYSYDDDFGNGGCCGTNFVTRYTDGRGHTTHYRYDSRGNLIQKTESIPSIQTDWQYNAYGQMTLRVLPDNGSGHRRSDAFTYFDSGHQKGYRQQQIIDQANLALTTHYAYDPVGNLVRIVDPRGHDRLFVYNALDQVQSAYSEEMVAGSGIRYARHYAYDANDNLVRVDVTNLNQEGLPGANALFTTVYEYEILNHLIEVRQEVDQDHDIVQRYAYDANRNRIEALQGEASAGRQPSNRVAMRYDERDLLFQWVEAPGDPLQATHQLNYDGNGNLVQSMRGLEEQPRIATLTYDGFNRLTRIEDPMGNLTLNSYDPAGNLVAERVFGELLDVPGSGGNLPLAALTRTFDPLNRLTAVDHAFFDAQTQAPIDDGLATTSYHYNGLSQWTLVSDDNQHAVAYLYDSANRNSQVIDAKGNTYTYTYDANANLLATTTREKSDLGLADELFTTTRSYDPLNRLLTIVDNDQNTRSFAYDSRSNLTSSFDAIRPNNPSDPGNLVQLNYDGLNRPIQRTYQLTADGTGTGTVTGSLVVRREYDDSSRLTAQIDSHGNRTQYLYDPLNRLHRIVFADGTVAASSYDVHGNTSFFQDAVGNQIGFVYDAANRVSGVNALPGPGVASDTTFELYHYDGLSRLVSGEDNDSIVSFSYDSLSALRAETLNGLTTTYTRDGLGNRLQVVYPGGRSVARSFDALDRPVSLSDAEGPLADYAYVGPTRVAQRAYRNGTRSAYSYDAVQRLTAITERFDPDGANLLLNDTSLAWDRMHNKTLFRDNLTARQQTFGYDALYRLVRSTTSQPQAPDQSIAYSLDGVGNRTQVSGGAAEGAYLLASDPTLPNHAMNQYTQTPFGTYDYDANGNLVAQHGDQEVTDVYDVRNQLVLHHDHGQDLQTHYRYDVLGRRIEKAEDQEHHGQVTRYTYEANQVIEERDGNDQLRATYVYGRYLDEVLTMTRDGATYFYHGDDQYSVLAVSDQAGRVVERTQYQDFGQPTIRDAAGKTVASSQIGNPYLFNGRRYDPESGRYDYRSRYLDPRLGRFTSRDRIGIWGDPQALGNGATYIGNNPWSGLDPFGLYCTGDDILDNQGVRDKIKELIAMKDEQHEPWYDPNVENSTDPDVIKNHAPHLGETTRETMLPIYASQNGPQSGPITISEVPYSTGPVRVLSHIMAHIHTHPANVVMDSRGADYHQPSPGDRNLANIVPATYIVGDEYMVQYNKQGAILGRWRIEDLLEDCDPCDRIP